MKYIMSPNDYFIKIIEAYHKARLPKYYHPDIKRGRSTSISSYLEDLTALWIAFNNPNQCSYFTDQPIKFEGSTTKYPDIVIQNNKTFEIKNLIDVKTDIGWNREGMYQFCEEWEKRIESVKNTNTSFRNGNGLFSDELTYHVLVISKINSGKKIEADYEKVREELKNVKLYILSDRVHPNNYEFNIGETMDKILIHKNEFDRLITHIIKSK